MFQLRRSAASAAIIFANEARYTFASEAALFALITMTAAVAIASGAVAAIDFLRALGYL